MEEIMNRNKKWNIGFTLAEVLITLGIVGVVSAIVIPKLISKYDKFIIETNLKKTYAELNNVIKMAEAENGSFEGWDFSAYADNIVDKYFAPYMKLTPCRSSKCAVFNGFPSWYAPTATAARGSLQPTNILYKAYNSSDGRVFIFMSEYYKDWNGKVLQIIVDVNGNRGRTVMGQDVFMFSLCNFRGITNRLKVGPGASWSETHSTEYLTENCIKSIPYVMGYFRGSACTHLLERNNWKFPKNYPIKF